MSISKLFGESSLRASANTATSVILTLSNYDLYADSVLFRVGGLSDDIKKIIMQTYIEDTGPSWDQPIKIDNFPAGHYLWADKDSNGNLTPKLDAASIESLTKAISNFKVARASSLLLESYVLREIVNSISPMSLAQIKAYAGASFEEDRLSLPKFWKIVKDSHAKANTTTMLESLQNIIHLNMNENEDYYGYLEKVSQSSRNFSSVFKLYMDLPLKTFVDLLMSLCTIGGLNKANNEFDTAIHEVRNMDLGTPSKTPLFEVIIALLTKAHHTRTLLVNKPNLQGLTAIPNTQSPLQALQSEVLSTCKDCSQSMPRAIDRNTNKPFPRCKSCYMEAVNAKKLALKPSGKEPKSTSNTKIKLNSVTPKVANTHSFAGSTPKLTASSAVMSESQQYLMNNGCNENFEFVTDNDNNDE